MADLSAYELQRAENIKARMAYFLKLGLDEDVKALKPKPKPKPAPKEKPAQSGPARRSSRLDGLPPEDDGVEPEAAWKPPDAPARDHLACWWTATEENPGGDKRPPLTKAQLTALETPLTTEQRESLVPEDNVDLMVEDALKFLRCYGGIVPEKFCVPSRENFKKVLDTIAVLVSGEGITCNYRGGVFDKGVLYTTRSDLEDGLSRGLKWLPMRRTSSGPWDKSNGWTINHPFTKFMQYQRACYWKHLFPFVWPDARASPHAAAAEAAAAEAAAAAGSSASSSSPRSSASAASSSAPSPLAAQASVAKAAAPKGAKPSKVARAAKATKPSKDTKDTKAPTAAKAAEAAAATAEAGSSDSDAEEAVPLSKRQRGAAAEAAAATVPAAAAAAAVTRFAHGEGDKVEMWRGGAWQPAWVENVNEDDGTFNLVCDDGDEDLDRVAADLIRPRSRAGTHPNPNPNPIARAGA